jgi:hypothetical protein
MEGQLFVKLPITDSETAPQVVQQIPAYVNEIPTCIRFVSASRSASPKVTEGTVCSTQPEQE